MVLIEPSESTIKQLFFTLSVVYTTTVPDDAQGQCRINSPCIRQVAIHLTAADTLSEPDVCIKCVG